MNNMLKLRTKRQINNFVRIKPPVAMMVFKADLLNHDWQEDSNEAYDAFLETFLTLYKCHCPGKNHKKRDKPWLTKGWKKLRERKIDSLRNLSSVKQSKRSIKTD